MQTPSVLPDYGSVKDQGDEQDRSFDADNTYYLKDSANETLTVRQRFKKLFLVLVPILAALLIVGGAAFLIWRDFGRLYPGGRGGNQSSERNRPIIRGPTTTTTSYTDDAVVNPEPEKPSPPPAPSPPANPKKSKNVGEAACSVHPKCGDLRGDCCPTRDGIFLACCK